MRREKVSVRVVVAMMLVAAVTNVYASRLQIKNPVVVSMHGQKGYAQISCNVSWDKAWKNDLNCDAVWLFAKYKDSKGIWKHATLKGASPRDFNYSDQSPDLFCAGSHKELGLWVPETKKGAFLFRLKGTGDVVTENVMLGWDISKDRLKIDELRNTEIKVFGVEMVYVPEDKHYVGDPKGKDGPDNCLYTYPDKGAYLIDSEKAIKVDAKDGYLYCDQDNPRSRDDVPFTIPEAFPKGYKAFWCMKYELTSEQYVDMLNTLTRKQQQAHVESDISGDEIKDYYVMTKTEDEKIRQSIVAPKRGNGTDKPVKFYTYAPARACNFIGWADLEAYADWAGLRPVTDLEYEKACRGPEKAESNDYAWGTTYPVRADFFDGADGSGYEKKVPETGLVNCCFHGGIAPFEIAAGKKVPDNPGFEGPVSVGLFENTQHAGIDKRLNDGASYYGIMELSGNCWERIVTFGHPNGRKFKGSHGDGMLNSEGYADVKDWPGKEGKGGGNRGGVWSSPAGKYLFVALRFAGNLPRADRGKNSSIRVGF